jgi:nucleotide-binding universal stress UspA family protein
MLPPKLILSPIDFSDHSTQALDVSAGLASKFGSELCLAHVVPMISDLPNSVSMLKEGEYEQDLHGQAENKLNELAQQLSQRGIRARTIVGTANDVGMEIIRLAESENADLIVIATHGMTGWRPFVFGSVAEKIVRNGSCPVLLLRAQEASKTQDSNAVAVAS